MNEINTLDLISGKKFDFSLSLDGKSELIPAGFAIDDNDIKLFSYWKIKKLFQIDETSKQTAINTSRLKADSELFRKEVDNLYNLLNTFYNEMGSRGIASPSQVTANFQNIYGMVKENLSLLLLIINCKVTGKTGLIQNTVETIVYSLAMGAQLRLPEERLKELYDAACMINIGMIIDKKNKVLLTKTEKLTVQEVQSLMTDPLIAFKTIRDKLNLETDKTKTEDKKRTLLIAAVVLMHHENIDGSGYPRKITGEKIHLYAKIISIAHHFTALREDKSYKPAKPLVEALKEVNNEGGKKFEPKILKIFSAIMSLYPIGTMLLLSNDCICAVINVSASPIRPVVKVILNEQRKQVQDGEVIDLSTEKNLQIKRAIWDKALEKRIFDFF